MYRWKEKQKWRRSWLRWRLCHKMILRRVGVLLFVAFVSSRWTYGLAFVRSCSSSTCSWRSGSTMTCYVLWEMFGYFSKRFRHASRRVRSYSWHNRRYGWCGVLRIVALCIFPNWCGRSLLVISRMASYFCLRRLMNFAAFRNMSWSRREVKVLDMISRHRLGSSTWLRSGCSRSSSIHLAMASSISLCCLVFLSLKICDGAPINFEEVAFLARLRSRRSAHFIIVLKICTPA